MRSRLGLVSLSTLTLCLIVPVAFAQEAPTALPDQATRATAAEPVETVVRVRVPSTDALRRMANQGVDVTHEVAQGPNGTFEATVIVPHSRVARLHRFGAEVLDTFAAPTRAEVADDLKGNAAELTAAQKRRALQPPATTDGSTRGATEAPASARPAAGSLTVLRADRWMSGGQSFLSVEVRSDNGAADEVTVETDGGTTYTLSPFVDRGVYLYHRMREPVPTDGAVESVTASSSDGSSVQAATAEWAAGGSSGFPRGFRWGFTDDGYVDATQADAVIERLAAQYPDLAEIVELPNPTHGYNLPDGERLRAPKDYPHDPYTVQAIRIGADRDGSKTGVLLYAQEHAREWVTSLVALETAQRLLHNYGSDPTTTALVDDLDIFIVPMVNPDGTAYSLYDNLLQRTNMDVDDCAYTRPLNAGTDVNRNFSVGSLFDGFVGASRDCTSQVYAGEAELSEAESRNEVSLTQRFPNIKFAMNTHSYGGYFMWSPGAYMEDRTTLPRPDLATEQYFFQASETILSSIKEFRGTVVWPGRTGPVVDVLYSAAGNSGDEMFYDDALTNDPEIYAWDFEVGVPLWDEKRQRWDEEGTGQFWPDFKKEGFAQAMEFANGWYGILEVARQFSLDDDTPESDNNVDDTRTYDGPVDVYFDTSEAATVYYTLDGSQPTWESPTVEQDGIRGGAAPVTLTEPRTVLQWFSVDEAGNVENGYDPDGTSSEGVNREVISIG